MPTSSGSADRAPDSREARDPPGGRRARPVVRLLVSAVLGALIGFGVGGGIYLLANPLFEASDNWLEEFQGLLWNVVPLGTLAGLVAGVVFASRRLRHRAS